MRFSGKVYEILMNVLREIEPNKEEEENVTMITNEIYIKLKNRFPEAEIRIEGSTAKGTRLKGGDVDIFVYFPKVVGREWIRSKFIEITKDALSEYKSIISYAEHPYLKIIASNLNIDVVPALFVERGDKAITSVDRTRFHTEYIKQHMSPEQRKEVMLLKSFMKGLEVYGAEISVEGFSGYVCELLIIKYGTFLNVIEEASKWIPPVEVKIVEGKKHNHYISIPDPVDPNRNASAAVSLKSLVTFILGSKLFLEKPDIKYFWPFSEKVKLDYDESGKFNTVIIEIETSEIIEEKLWGIAKRLSRKITNILNERGFPVLFHSVIVKGNIIGIALDLASRNPLPMIHEGPPINEWENVKKFMEKNKWWWISENGKLLTIKEKKENIREVILKELAKESLGQVRVTFIEEIKGEMPEWLIKHMRKKPKVF
jgi:tRNA nucleotidyltransferase (CCA-adding enzyme)